MGLVLSINWVFWCEVSNYIEIIIIIIIILDKIYLNNGNLIKLFLMKFFVWVLGMCFGVYVFFCLNIYGCICVEKIIKFWNKI